jgi:hypoxanthine phosphoribosyltransferase
MSLLDSIEEVLFDQVTIATRIREMGKMLEQDYAGKNPLFVGILTGAAIFASDLVRAVNIPLEMDFMSVASYIGTESSGSVRILKDMNKPIEGRHVVLVEDIVDSGLTIKHLLELLATRKPASVTVCALLHKHKTEAAGLEVRYLGFSCPNKFVVGYGLDYNGHFRNVPLIGVLKPSVYTTPAH